MRRIERDPCFYHDESGERFHQLFADAEVKRAKRINGVKQTLFWMTVIALCSVFVYLSAMNTRGQ